MKYTFQVEIEFNTDFDQEISYQDAKEIVDGILDRGYEDLAEQLDEDDDDGLGESKAFKQFGAILDVKIV